jgi:hypothetical protein
MSPRSILRVEGISLTLFWETDLPRPQTCPSASSNHRESAELLMSLEREWPSGSGGARLPSTLAPGKHSELRL